MSLSVRLVIETAVTTIMDMVAVVVIMSMLTGTSRTPPPVLLTAVQFLQVARLP